MVYRNLPYIKYITISNCSIFCGEQTAVKFNNYLIVAHWLNIFCKRGGVIWRNCYQRNVNVTQLFPYALSYSGVYRPGKLANE